MKKLTISLGLIGILAVMAALIIAIGSLGHGYNVESIEIDLTFGYAPDQHFCLTRENGSFLLKYRPVDSEEWKEYNITPYEFFSVANVDISEYVGNEDRYSIMDDGHITKRYRDGHTKEVALKLPEVRNALVPITEKHGVHEPVYLMANKSGGFVNRTYEAVFYKKDGRYPASCRNATNYERELSQEDFNAVLNTEFPDYAYDPTKTEHTSEYYYEKMLGDTHYADVPSYFVRKQYNDGYFEDVITYFDSEIPVPIMDIANKYNIYLDGRINRN